MGLSPSARFAMQGDYAGGPLQGKAIPSNVGDQRESEVDDPSIQLTNFSSPHYHYPLSTGYEPLLPPRSGPERSDFVAQNFRRGAGKSAEVTRAV
jgi:hypothetical protein